MSKPIEHRRFTLADADDSHVAFRVWLQITGGGRLYEYMAWINRMTAEWRQANRLDRFHPVDVHLFTAFLQGKLALARAREAA